MRSCHSRFAANRCPAPTNHQTTSLSHSTDRALPPQRPTASDQHGCHVEHHAPALPNEQQYVRGSTLCQAIYDRVPTGARTRRDRHARSGNRYTRAQRSCPTSIALAGGWLRAVNGARMGSFESVSTRAARAGVPRRSASGCRGVRPGRVDRNRERPRTPLRSSTRPPPSQRRHPGRTRARAIAATDPSSFVWATSKTAMARYRVTNTSQPAVTGTIVFRQPARRARRRHALGLGRDQRRQGHPDRF